MKYDFEHFCALFEHDIRGEFAFILLEFDKSDKLLKVTTARDHVGVRPLYTNIHTI
jgi:asparagine synthetase B (glutamine-hydrolysing)